MNRVTQIHDFGPGQGFRYDIVTYEDEDVGGGRLDRSRTDTLRDARTIAKTQARVWDSTFDGRVHDLRPSGQEKP